MRYILGPCRPLNVSITNEMETEISIFIRTNTQEQVNGYFVMWINTRNETFNQTVKDQACTLYNLTAGTEYNISVFAMIIYNGKELVSDGAFSMTAYTRKLE